MSAGFAPVAWGVVGYGDVVKRKSGPALLAEPSARVAGVTRICGDLFGAAADLGCRPFPDLTHMAADPSIDAIYIATPPDTHEALAIQALKARKPVVVEKPIAPTAAAGVRMIAAAERYGASLSVAFYRRCSPRLRRIESLLAAGAVGRVEAVEIVQMRADPDFADGDWRANPEISPGGRFSDSHIHVLDWLRRVFGPHQLVAGAPDAGARSDMVAYALRLRDAPIAGVFRSAVNRAEERLSIHGSEGRLETRFFEEAPIEIHRDGGVMIQEVAPPAHPHQPFFAEMARHIRLGVPSPCPAAEALGASEIVDRLLAA